MIISFNAKFDVNDIDHIYMVRQKPEVQLLVYMIIKQSLYIFFSLAFVISSPFLLTIKALISETEKGYEANQKQSKYITVFFDT